ncbi:KOW domain-containing RNA-binding protein [bacterium]|nr:KOW domain-containing RNA-binding protein [bacterium]MCI6429854.1 KOW domain-containing RNA-binding protein [Lachnospiraceae bacterium]MDY3021414.1 KOW domain-containing RNA-binding protein [Oliverpabstia sp.]MDY5025964.1 KOW domain-containing RNA-binding protein [Oliverpabstia sp.]
MEGYSIGMMAKSLAGHDKGKVYLVSGADETYVYLVDGKCRTMDRPKRKKKKHVQIDYQIPEWIQKLLAEGKSVQDSDVIKVRREYGR